MYTTCWWILKKFSFGSFSQRCAFFTTEIYSALNFVTKKFFDISRNPPHIWYRIYTSIYISIWSSHCVILIPEVGSIDCAKISLISNRATIIKWRYICANIANIADAFGGFWCFWIYSFGVSVYIKNINNWCGVDMSINHICYYNCAVVQTEVLQFFLKYRQRK